MQVSITSDISTAWRLPFSTRELETALREMWLAFEPAETSPFPDDALLEFALVDEAEMARLNEENLSCAGPTNVLAFPAGNSGPRFGSGAGFRPGAGLLAMSPWTMRREAMLYGQDLAAYTLRLLAHGLAHLLGHEHGPAMDEAAGRAARAAALALCLQLEDAARV